MTLGASGCEECVGAVVVVTGSSGSDQLVGPVDVVTGWWIYSLPHNEVSLLLVSVLFGSLIPTFCSIFVNCFIFLFLLLFYFSNLIRERIILEYFQHLAIQNVLQGQ